jgi:hypothetical protein
MPVDKRQTVVDTQDSALQASATPTALPQHSALPQALRASEARSVTESVLRSDSANRVIAADLPLGRDVASDAAACDQDKPLTPQQEDAVMALVSHPTMIQAAQAAGINESTLWRWRKSPAFQKRYREVRRELMAQTSGLLQAAAVEAVGVLRAVATDLEAPPSQRVLAARTTLELAFRAADLDDVGARIDELEKRLTGRSPEEITAKDAAHQDPAHQDAVHQDPVQSDVSQEGWAVKDSTSTEEDVGNATRGEVAASEGMSDDETMRDFSNAGRVLGGVA